MKKINKAFTLIEIIIAILIISIIFISWFQLFSMAFTSKIKIDEQIKLEKNIFYFSEKLFTLIKKWWTLDYEEYFNRKVVWTDLKNWHFEKNTWFWNFWQWTNFSSEPNFFWTWFYYCVSNINGKVWKKWCFLKEDQDTRTYSLAVSRGFPSIPLDYFTWNQRYWQYSYQFIDYNSDANNDFWDANWDWKINRDDDDKHLWIWPEVFDHWENVHELYLISWDKKKRTYFRWNIKQDEFSDKISSFPKCNTNPSSLNFQYCRWTIEFLELEWKDWWMNHDWTWEYANDWVIDTWLIASNFSWKTNQNKANSIIAWSSNDTWFWKPLFSDDINISDFKVSAYPNIDSSKVWNITTDEQNKYLISSYVVLSIEIKPSWKVKRKIKWDIKPIKFNTTINLTDIFSNSN